MRLFLTIALLLASHVANAQSKVWTLIIGISDYQYFNSLTYADDDALAFQTMLEKTLGDRYVGEQTRVLLNQSATASAVEYGLRWILDNANEGDRAYIYYSGHGGYEDITVNKLGYLHTYNAHPATFSSGGHISLIYLQSILSSLSTKGVTTIFVSDACHSGKSEGNAEAYMFLNNSLALQTENIYKILSAQDNEKSYENKQWGGGHGVFTYYLIRGLMGFADTAPQDNMVSMQEIERYLANEVPLQTEYLQNPKVVGSDKRTFYLARVDKQEFELYKELFQEEEPNLMASLARGSQLKEIQQLTDTLDQVYNDFISSLNSNSDLESTIKLYDDFASMSPNHPLLSSMMGEMYVHVMNQSQRYLNSQLDYAEERSTFTLEELKTIDNACQGIINRMDSNDPARQSLFVRHSYLRAEIKHWEFDQWDLSKSELKTALPALLEAIELDVTSAYLYGAAAAIYYHAKDYENAVLFSKKAIEYAPNWSIPLNNLGNTYSDMKEADSAKYYYQQAVDLSPHYPAAYANLASEINWLSTDNIEELQTCATLYKKASQYSRNLGTRLQYDYETADIYREIGKLTHDPTKLDDAIALLTPYTNIPERYAIVLEGLSRMQFERDPDSPDSWISASRMHALKSRHKKALDQLRLAIDAGFNDFSTFESYGEVAELINSEGYRELKK